jgi:hypothetical protein
MSFGARRCRSVRIAVASWEELTLTSARPEAPTSWARGRAQLDSPSARRQSAIPAGLSGAARWIQLVRSTDNSSGGDRFEPDPLEVLGPLPHPFCSFGIKPTLFDAPSRDSRADLDWLAHSILCRIADPDRHEVHALAGFGWGFTITAGIATPALPHRPFLYRNELLPADGVEEQRPAASGEVKRLGANPTVVRLKVGGAAVEVATQAEDAERMLGPFR